ncbi:MAG TPA: RsmB/NOP family class I SAM-dependent RNA methyltransferase [Acetobacteraceae bacterium]|nr:RsmB/NOP family class I SAM-dependent RNA methyltransferase [Acetobacteraceae bacterium]
MTTDPTRDGALSLLTAVLEHHIPLDRGLLDMSSMAPRDRAAAHRLAAAVLRRLGTLDSVLEPFLRRSPPPLVQHALRLGAAGLLLLNTPAHAAVATAVALVRRQGFPAFTGLVNAVLRRLAAAGPAALEELDGPRLDTPAWLWASWGPRARAIAEIHALEPPLDLTLRPGTSIPPGGELLPTGSIRLPPGQAVSSLPGFAAGDFWVQDVAAAMPARLLAAHPGERVADLCAAPGGKTAQLVLAGARVTAVDRDATRLARLGENLARLCLSAEIVTADVTTWAPGETFPAILLDAPCSATGTIRRHPDILRLRQPRDILSLTELQNRLLDAAEKLLAPGGRLIYSVCSLQPEEGPARIAAACARLGLRLDPFTRSELSDMPEARTKEGYFATDPGLWASRGGMDGFFAARLRRP